MKSAKELVDVGLKEITKLILRLKLKVLQEKQNYFC